MTEIAFCDHCHEKRAVFADYRGPDVISKYALCEDCAGMSDAEFFGIVEFDPLSCNHCQKAQPETIQAREGGDYSVCSACAVLSDDEFFNRVTKTPSGEYMTNII